MRAPTLTCPKIPPHVFFSASCNLSIINTQDGRESREKGGREGAKESKSNWGQEYVSKKVGTVEGIVDRGSGPMDQLSDED